LGVRGLVMRSFELTADGLAGTLRLGAFSMRFHRIPTGVYQVGLSEDEHASLLKISPSPNITRRELEPVIRVELADGLFVGERPFTVEDAVALGVQVDGDVVYPAMVTLDEARTLCSSIGCRLPVEVEWEIACRGSTTSAFVWGDKVPTSNELDRWLDWDLSASVQRSNAFGLKGLFFGEWCDEPFRFSHAASAEVEDGSVVVKGGGAQFWPWQHEEWVWCLPAMRMPSSGLLDDGRCAARPVFRVGEGTGP
jgi:hypothetical protein